MADASDVDLTSMDPPWPTVSHQFICQGKKWHDVPAFVRKAFADLLEPPSHLMAHFPSPDLPIPDLLALTLPTQTTSLSLFPASSWLSASLPTQLSPAQHSRLVHERTIPPPEVLVTLGNKLGQFWLD